MYLGRRFALPWAISFCPFGAGTSQPYRVGTVPGFSPYFFLGGKAEGTVPHLAIKRELETLRLAGRIEFIGPSKTGTYQLVGT